MDYSLRPATATDAPFLYELHAASMREAIEATWGWDEAWQRAYFAAHFAPERIQVVEVGGQPVGMVEQELRPSELYVNNIKLLPEVQGRGIGSAILRAVMREAAARGVPVRLQVLEANVRARRLYERLGFVAIGGVPPHVLLEHGGGGAPTAG